MSIDETQLDDRLRASRRADPVVPPVILADLAVATQTAARTTRRRRLGAIALAGTLLLAGGTASAPAIADGVNHFLAVLDIPIGSGTEIIEDSPWVDPAASDFPDFVESIYPDYLVLAPGWSREQVVEAVVGAAANSDGLSQAIGYQYQMEVVASCGWAAEWLAADAEDDQSRLSAASLALAETVDWPALAAVDGGGVTDVQRALAEGASAGDHWAVTSWMQGMACSGFGIGVAA